MKEMCRSIGVIALLLTLASGAGAIDKEKTTGGRPIQTVRPTAAPTPKPDPFKAPDAVTAQSVCDAMGKDVGLACKAYKEPVSPDDPEGALQDWSCLCE